MSVKDPAAKNALGVINFLGTGIVWVICILLILHNMNFNITTLLAGVSVGGIAITFASQKILADLFSALSIVFDKPFAVGQTINFKDITGTVQYVGLKSTRLKILTGEEIIVSNSDLLSQHIKNFHTRTERRFVLNLGVTYQTPYKKLIIIPELIRTIIENQEGVRFERAHFTELADSALNFEAVYWSINPDFIISYNLQQAINLEVIKRFEEKKIDFAYPTQKIHITKEYIETEAAQEEE